MFRRATRADGASTPTSWLRLASAPLSAPALSSDIEVAAVKRQRGSSSALVFEVARGPGLVGTVFLGLRRLGLPPASRRLVRGAQGLSRTLFPLTGPSTAAFSAGPGARPRECGPSSRRPRESWASCDGRACVSGRRAVETDMRGLVTAGRAVRLERSAGLEIERGRRPSLSGWARENGCTPAAHS
jgi:hypothetical protein